jgi:hypothetical protein
VSGPGGVVPTEEELVAIVAADELAWPRPVVLAGPSAPPTPAWRFSGRSWQLPVSARRERPWR